MKDIGQANPSQVYASPIAYHKLSQPYPLSMLIVCYSMLTVREGRESYENYNASISSLDKPVAC